MRDLVPVEEREREKESERERLAISLAHIPGDHCWTMSSVPSVRRAWVVLISAR